MINWPKRSLIMVGTGVAVGLAIIAWINLRPTEEAAVDSAGGSVPLASDTPAPTADPLQLKVTQAGPGSVQGAAQTTGGDSARDKPAATAAAPSPDDFKQYEQYRDSQQALFGDITAGEGQEVVMGSKVTVAYRGWLTNGQVFDESYARGTNYTFTEGEHRVIAGWEQGLLGMKAGGKRRLIVPPSVGYGAEAREGIPANSVLVFDIELLEVK